MLSSPDTAAAEHWSHERLTARLRDAGSVFAEQEAEILRERAAGDWHLLDSMERRRAAGEPLEPLVGWIEFGRLRLSVGPGVFVPRQRSLFLAALAVERVHRVARAGVSTVFVEAYCGVAPIATSVVRACPSTAVWAVDHDARAIAHASVNLGPDGQARVSDGLSALLPRSDQRIDVVAAVPPYVPDDALALLPREATEHEPRTALTAGVDGLDHVRRLIEEARELEAGTLLIELHVEQFDAAAEFAARSGYAATLHNASDRHTCVLAATLLH